MFTEIASTPVFKGFKTSEIIQLLNKVHHQIRTYEEGDIIAYCGDPCECLYLLLEGRVRGVMIDYNGKSIVVSEVHAPDTFAEGFLFADKHTLLLNIIANSHAKVMVIYQHDLLEILNSNRRILENYLSITSNRFVIITEKIRFLMLKTVKAKLANYILDLEKDNKGKVRFKLGKTHEELAAYFGITRPVLTRNLLQIKRDGLVDISHKEIIILDRERLLKLLP